MLVPMLPLKDEMLSRLAEHANVAQFLSFGPGQDLPQRHSRLRGLRPGHRFPSPEEGVGALVRRAAGGEVPLPRPDAVRREAVEADQVLAAMALDMLAYAAEGAWSFRIGINSGPAVAGVIGTRKFQYDLWGDTVNMASRMESHGIPGKIQVTEAVRDRLADRYELVARGEIDVKGRGRMETYLLGKRIR